MIDTASMQWMRASGSRVDFPWWSACLGVSVVILLALASCTKQPETRPSVDSGQTARDAAPAGDSETIVALNNRGVGLMGRFEYESARQFFEQAVTMQPTNAELIVNLAIATLNRQREGDEDRALALLEDAIKADPGNVRAIYCQGILRLYLQSPEAAQPFFERIEADEIDDAYVAYFLGQCFAQQRMYEDALIAFQKAIQRDDKLRSAYYAASQSYRAVGADDEAAKMLAEFQALERNPQARLAEFKYTRMGPKAMVQAINDPASHDVAATRPQGPLFLDPQPLLTNGDQFTWKAGRDDRATSITACDIDSDGDIDIFIADCLEGGDGADGLRNAVCINDGTGTFTLDPTHALANISDVNAALWGDMENDGLADVYLCRRGANMLWRQVTKGAWKDVTAATQSANGEFDSVDGAIFDADHDGDLDIFVVNANGPNELLNNNLDGTFKPIAKEAGIAGEGEGSRQVLPVDLDSDRDLDIVVINSAPPHEAWRNDRAWSYKHASSLDALCQGNATAAVAGDVDVDGRMEVICADRAASVICWQMAGDEWQSRMLTARSGMSMSGLPSDQIALIDARGEGHTQIVRYENGWQRLSPTPDGKSFEWQPSQEDAPKLNSWAALNDSVAGAMMLGMTESGPLVWRAGPARHEFATVSFSGRQVTSDNRQIRSNASGIGVHYAARIGSRWVAGHTLRQSSGPGQSLQPALIGLGGASIIDFLSITWPDGVFQTELDLETGKHHVIEETQRQLSSCPVLFAWDGERHRFITDVLGVGGMGFLIAPGEYAPSRPWENLLLPSDVIQPRDGEYVLKLGEPMEEACYLDSASLIAYDLPEGWDMTLDERMGVNGPEPTGQPLFYREASLRLPESASSGGVNVTAAVRNADRVASDVGEVDDRFIGLLKKDQVLTLEFPPLPKRDASGESEESRRFALLIDGWIEYPYSQTMFAASQAGGWTSYQAPTLEMKSRSGEWHVVYEQFGYPAGMPRQMSLPLPPHSDFTGAVELRIRTNQEVYFDRVALVEVEECPQARRIVLPLKAAALADVGFAKRTNGPQRQPDYDYLHRSPLWDTRHQRGWYTEFGGVDELVRSTDDALAIFGPGEEVEFRFESTSLSMLERGWSRRFVLELHGWCKDMDLYTKDGDAIEPLPVSDPASNNELRSSLHRRYNTRYESGH